MIYTIFTITLCLNSAALVALAVVGTQQQKQIDNLRKRIGELERNNLKEHIPVPRIYDVKEQIGLLHKSGLSQRKIALLLNISRSMVQRTLKANAIKNAK